MTERTPETDAGEIWLDGMPFAVQGDVVEDMANLFPRKVNQGDPRPDDHPTMSTSIQNDWSGGAMVHDLNPASDQGRFHFSTCETRYPGSMTLPPKTHSFTAPNGEPGSPTMIGDYLDRFYFSWGHTLYRYEPSMGIQEFVADLPSAPTPSGGTVYREESAVSQNRVLLFIPLTNGYVVVDEAGDVYDGTDTNHVVSFCVWDDKLFKLMGDGSLWWVLSEPLESEEWTLSGWIPDGSTPTRLLRYMDKSENPCLFIVTTSSTWKHDFGNSVLHSDDLDFPKHPTQGLAADVHNQAVYVSAGMTIYEYNNSTINVGAGLDARDSLPVEWRGVIVDMQSGLGGLYALVYGLRESSPIQDTEDYSLHLGHPDPFDTPPQDASNLLMVDSGYGWHYVWSGRGIRPTNVMTSVAQSRYRLFWGSNGQLHYQDLPIVPYNPSDVDTRGREFERTCTHYSGWNAWGWVNQDKIMKQIEVSTKRLRRGSFIEVSYQINDPESEWHTLPPITRNGRTRFPLGLDPDEPVLRNGVGHHKGIRHERYRLRFTIHGVPDDISHAPLLEWHAVVARRWLRPQRTWRLRLDLSKTTKDYPSEVLLHHLFSIATRQEAVVFEYADRHYMVELTLNTGPGKTGRGKQWVKSVTLMESQDLDRNAIP